VHKSDQLPSDKMESGSARLEDSEDLVDYDCDLDLEVNKDEYSDLNQVSDSEQDPAAACLYCEKTGLTGLDALKEHLVSAHSVTKNLEYLVDVTTRRQEQEIVRGESISPEPLIDEEKLPDELLADDVSDIESDDGDLLDTVAMESEQQLNGEQEKPSQEETQSQLQTDELKIKEEWMVRDGPEVAGTTSNTASGDKTKGEAENIPIIENKAPAENILKEVKVEKKEEEEDEEKGKRDWKYPTEDEKTNEQDTDLISDDELQDEKEAKCKKCDSVHPSTEFCHFRIGKRDEKIRVKKSKRAGRLVKRSKLQERLGSKPKRLRTLPPELYEAPVGGGERIRTLPRDLYNNPDALRGARSPEGLSRGRRSSGGRSRSRSGRSRSRERRSGSRSRRRSRSRSGGRGGYVDDLIFRRRDDLYNIPSTKGHPAELPDTSLPPPVFPPQPPAPAVAVGRAGPHSYQSGPSFPQSEYPGRANQPPTLSQTSYGGGGGASYTEFNNYSNHPNQSGPSSSYDNAGYTQPRAGYTATASHPGFHSAGVGTGFDPNLRSASSGQANGSGYGYPAAAAAVPQTGYRTSAMEDPSAERYEDDLQLQMYLTKQLTLGFLILGDQQIRSIAKLAVDLIRQSCYTIGELRNWLYEKGSYAMETELKEIFMVHFDMDPKMTARLCSTVIPMIIQFLSL